MQPDKAIGAERRSSTLAISSERLNIENCDAIRAEGKALVERGVVDLIVDMSTVEFIDSSGLGALVALRKAVGSEGRVILLRPRQFVSRVIEITKMQEVFDVRH